MPCASTFQFPHVVLPRLARAVRDAFARAQTPAGDAAAGGVRRELQVRRQAACARLPQRLMLCFVLL